METVQHKPVNQEPKTGCRPPVKWVVTVKDSDKTIVIQFPVDPTEEIYDHKKIDR